MTPPSSYTTIVWFLAIVALGQAQEVDNAEGEVSMTMTFVNEMPDTPIELFWENNFSDERKSEGTIAPRGGFIDVKTFVGHEFSYDLSGSRHYIAASPPDDLGQKFVILAGDTQGIPVRCSLQREFDTEKEEGLLSPALEITVQPYWAPRGASRFLELVRAGYYDGVALNRVVPEFLIQFGIARDYDQRMEWDERTIPDDMEGRDLKFEPGFISFAGNGPNSRTTEIFIVMPGTSEEQLDFFGTSEWETPFGSVATPVEGSVLTRIYDGYGDMPPWGNGPDPDEIYDVGGYTTYLPQNFPKLDYIDRCFIVDEEGLDDLATEL